jgi:hypothetical protein
MGSMGKKRKQSLFGNLSFSHHIKTNTFRRQGLNVDFQHPKPSRGMVEK